MSKREVIKISPKQHIYKHSNISEDSLIFLNGKLLCEGIDNDYLIKRGELEFNFIPLISDILIVVNV